MTTTLLLATKNAGKIREFRALFWDLPKLIVKPADEVLALPDIDEDGRTFEENAAKKAREIARVTGHLVLADDSGLEVDALGGRPGVYSARYAGRHGDDEGNNDKLLLDLAGIADDKRGARYRVVLALADPRGPLGEDVHLETGVCEGSILRVRRGQNGFGYDPVFAPKAYDKTMAELSAEEKNEISHRAEAASKMRKFLGDYLAQRAAARAEAGSPASNGAAHAASAAQPAAAKPARPAAESQVTPVAAPPAAAAGTERSAETPASPAPAPSASKPKTGQRTAASKPEDAAARTPREKPAPAKAEPKKAPAPASGDDAGKPSPSRRGKPRVA